ncbi:DUF418 domain-containing protein [Fulvivirgaceae bacterium BMA10]|uniref:DUF418 domain-containing protein n=1 Tax=Splendidivirga corallicola TaxID=3051826 RepID=A0ABT8KMI4_9BACT|nr:DUF418 domain-containing protein [Fulvivirgaceae bacterium BMA10]
MNRRIIGIDVARALAVIGMIIVNFKIAFGEEGSGFLKSFAGIFEGKAAATFVVLAGVGIALMSNSAIKENNIRKIRGAQTRIAKRAFLLFIIGLSYIAIWPADILHFYGVYMLIALLLLKSRPKTILSVSLLIILVYPLFMLIWNYDTGWDFESFNYSDFWTVEGFTRNLFYNGFHPVIPWTAFMLIGLWFGKQNLHDSKVVKKTLWIGLSIFIAIQILSYGLISFLSLGSESVAKELGQILGTSPMPPLPIYMISGSSIALFIISACILISKKFERNRVVTALNKTGQLALTFYVAHVIIGMGVIEIWNPAKMGSYSIAFSLSYALLFSLLCVFFAVIWKKYADAGPLEWLFRKLAK